MHLVSLADTRVRRQSDHSPRRQRVGKTPAMFNPLCTISPLAATLFLLPLWPQTRLQPPTAITMATAFIQHLQITKTMCFPFRLAFFVDREEIGRVRPQRPFFLLRHTFVITRPNSKVGRLPRRSSTYKESLRLRI